MEASDQHCRPRRFPLYVGLRRGEQRSEERNLSRGQRGRLVNHAPDLRLDLGGVADVLVLGLPAGGHDHAAFRRVTNRGTFLMVIMTATVRSFGQSGKSHLHARAVAVDSGCANH